MFRTDDPIVDFHRHDAEQCEELSKRPMCESCEEHIQDEHYFDIGGTTLCEECLNDTYRKSVDDYLDSLED